MRIISKKRIHKTSHPRRLKYLAFHVECSEGNNLLHRFVLDNSDTNDWTSESYVGAVLRLMRDCDVNALNKDGFSALHLAVMKNNLSMVKALLSSLKNIDVDTRRNRGSYIWRNGDTALHLAVRNGSLPIIRELLSAKADVNITNGGFYTPLSQTTNLDIMRLLVAEGADVNRKGEGGAPLHFAARKGDLEAVKYLISCGADVNQTVKNPLTGRTPIECAVRSGNIEIIEFLVNNSADLSAEEGAIFFAAKCGKLEALKCLMSRGEDWNARDKSGRSTLHHAAESGDLATVEFLVGIGSDVNAKDAEKKTPLHAAARQCNAEVVQFLINKGADVNAKTTNFHTPLYCAVCENRYETSLLLVNHGANLTDVFYTYEETILHIAANSGSWRIVEMFIERGCDVNDTDVNGETALHKATRRGYLKVIKLLLDKGAQTYVQNKKGETPLDLAKKGENITCIATLQNSR